MILTYTLSLNNLRFNTTTIIQSIYAGLMKLPVIPIKLKPAKPHLFHSYATYHTRKKLKMSFHNDSQQFQSALLHYIHNVQFDISDIVKENYKNL